jgi:hypothetical protein
MASIDLGRVSFFFDGALVETKRSKQGEGENGPHEEG